MKSEEPANANENNAKDDSSGLAYVLDRVYEKLKDPAFDITAGYYLKGSEPFQQGRFHKTLESSTFQEFSRFCQEERLYRASFGSEEVEKFHHWIISSEHEFYEARNESLLSVLESYREDIKRIYKQGQEIHDGVALSSDVDDADREKSKPKNIALPISVVRAFRNFALFLMCMASAVKLIEGHFATKTAAENGKIGLPLKFDSVLIWFGMNAYLSIVQSYEDVTLMIRTDSSSEMVNYTAAGPRFISLSICEQLAFARFGSNEEKKQPVDIYEQIVYRAYYGRPSRRLLVTIQAAQEELEAMKKLVNEQWDARSDFWVVSRPATFRITSQSRHQQWRLENKLDDHFLADLKEKVARFSELKRRLDQLEIKARHRIEILDEDHNKAIMVITVTTLLFLPLSFVTSYMGMNTGDIRNMDSTQSLFWTIATPMTALILGLASLVAYKARATGRRESSTHRSIIGTEFLGTVKRETKIGEYDAIVPAVKGTAWITAFKQVILHPTDPFPEGFRVG
ncbi:hypothetical protein LQW54_010010 [Pestalotiopsis sp. IQ-011]